MSTVKLGDRVRVQYLGFLPDGRSISKSTQREVLAFTVGSEQVIPGISFGVVGMAVGDQKRMTLSAEQAFGPVDAKLRKEVSRKRLAPTMELFVGKRLLAIGARTGRKRRVNVVELRPESVIVDANHPFAGQAVEVEVQLVSRRRRLTEPDSRTPASRSCWRKCRRCC